MLKIYSLLIFMAAVFIVVVSSDLHHMLTFEYLKANHDILLSWVSQHQITGVITYLITYILVVLFSLPGATLMTLAGGFLFGAVWGGIFTVIGATTGAIAIFLIARTALGDLLQKQANQYIKKMQHGFLENELSYMFVLRLVPLFPFFAVNIAPAFLGVTLRAYTIATFFGIMPGTFIYTLAGSSLGDIFKRHESFEISAIFSTNIILALTGLALLSLLPVIYKKRHP